jgi:UDP-sulfoquinovose synthase
MNILILGMDGYIGWGLSLHLLTKGHRVMGIDNFSRRKNVSEIGSWSAIRIRNMGTRVETVRRTLSTQNYLGSPPVGDNRFSFLEGDLCDYDFLSSVLKTFRPETIVHLAEQPSAPFSMIDVWHAVYTQQNNVLGTLNLLFAMKEYCPDAHLVKLGTMGEYGTPPVDIPEGFFEIEYHGRKGTLMFPRNPGSFYHASKVHDTQNIMLACRIWNLRSTDIMQGVVYGTRTEEINPLDNSRLSSNLHTRFDFDEYFGTVINRYCAEAVIGYPLTVYGKGGQTRGFLALVDSVQCLTLICENPPEEGEYRVFNQIDETYNVRELADIVQKVATKKGLSVVIEHRENPRKEAEKHYYKVEAQHLKRLGFRPTRSLENELDLMLEDLMMFKERIKKKEHVIAPKTTWAGKTQLMVPALT